MLADYLRLMKPHVIWLLVFSAVVGYIIAAPVVNPIRLIELTVVGVASTGGSAAFNMYYERDIDGLMVRTMKRPLPSGRIQPNNALAFSISISAAGFLLSYTWLGITATMAVVAGWVLYAIVYTMVLKRRTWLNILIGGFAGNAALLAGWLTVRPLDLESLLLSMVIYLWIPAHIWSLTYYAKDDYLRAKVPMLTTMLSDESSIRVISALNLASTLYMLAMYQLYIGKPIGYTLVVPAVALGVFTTIKCLINPSAKSFRMMFKSTSPVLLLFLIAAIIPKII